MKPTTILIHAARGGVDYAALIEALKRGTIAAAALDVNENEPVLNPEFLALKNVMLTPPIASSIEAMRRTMALTDKPPHLLIS